MMDVNTVLAVCVALLSLLAFLNWLRVRTLASDVERLHREVAALQSLPTNVAERYRARRLSAAQVPPVWMEDAEW